MTELRKKKVGWDSVDYEKDHVRACRSLNSPRRC
jgi:hypothetical protein